MLKPHSRTCIRTIEQVIPDLRNTQDAKGNASNQRKALGAGEATGVQQENGKDDNDELRNIAARFNRMDATLQLEQDTRSLETAQLESRAAEEANDEGAAKNELIIGQQAKPADVLKLQEIMTWGNSTRST